MHKCTELANKNKIFSAVSGNTDKNYSDRGCSQRAIGGALLHKGDVLFIPFFWLAGKLAFISIVHISKQNGCEIRQSHR